MCGVITLSGKPKQFVVAAARGPGRQIKQLPSPTVRALDGAGTSAGISAPPALL
jgi:hypothetical protein